MRSPVSDGSSVSPYVEAGRRGARARWGEKRRINLSDLTDDQRRVVLGIIEAQRIANRARDRGEAA